MTRTLVTPAADNPVTDDPGDILDLCCDHHDNMQIRGTAQRARLQGWVVWDGSTVAGVPTARTLCPICTGRHAPDIDPDGIKPGEPFGWDGQCETCYSGMWEDWGIDGMPDHGWTEDDVREWFREHDCEPTLKLIPPRAAVPA